MSTRRAINLLSPVDYVVLIVQLYPEGWRFDGWKAAIGYVVPEFPPHGTLSRSFPTPERAAEFFSEVLTHPEKFSTPEATCILGRMPPAPECDYYWPRSLEHCIDNYKNDLVALSSDQIPIRRVLVLGAGFSSDFNFATSNTIVGRVMEFFRNRQPSNWYSNQYHRVQLWLDHRFPNWRLDPPSLYKFLDSFFLPTTHDLLSNFAKESDPFVLYEKGISWESENCGDWLKDGSYLPNQNTYEYLRSFEALLAVYLLAARTEDEVALPWTTNLFKNIQTTDAILTFNWDVIPEFVMVKSDIPFCRYDWTFERTKLVKLHGSCDLLGSPNITMRYDLEMNHSRFECITSELWRARTSDDVLVRTIKESFGGLMWPSERYNKSAVFIMPPWYPLGYGYRLIQFNWRKARTALERAKEVYIIGYSMPDEDIAFRSLALKVSTKWNSHVTVDIWNPDPVVGDRAENLFGRQRVTFHQARASSFRFR